MDGSSSAPVSRYANSQRLYEAARQVIAGGVNINLRLDSTPVPLFFSRGAGAQLWDADGNRYVDYVLGIGPCVLGHAPAALTAALQAALTQGLAYAAQHEAEVALGRLLCEVIPCAELIRLNMTGSEADHAALRTARAFTGRTRIVKFEGHYHGWFDNELISTKVPLDDPGYLEAPRLAV